MTTSGIDDPEVARLTARRFATMKPFGGRGAPREVDLSALPPGPGWHPALQTVALLRFRHRFVPWLHRRYGDTFTLRILPAGRTLVLFSRPEHVKEVFAGDPEQFHAGKANAILGPIMGRHSLLLQDGMEHKRARRLLMPAFNGGALRGYEALVTEVARAELATWQPGETFGALDRMNRLTLEVILRVVFGVSDEGRLAELRPRVLRTVDVSPAVLLGGSIPRLQHHGIWRRAIVNAFELDQLIHAEIRERRAAPDLAERTDVLSRLILTGTDAGTGTGADAGTGTGADASTDAGDRPLDDEELRDQLVTLLLAGHETTASALAWALHEIGRDRAQARRAVEAARTGDEDWLEAVLKEAMRLHPVIPMVGRTLMAPATIGGHDLPRGVSVGCSILLAHASAEHHPDPERFRPERFLGHNPPTNTWIPFGGGVRRCIGAGFSLMEGTTVLREVLLRFEVTAVGREVPKVRNITSVPRRGARIRISA